MSSSMSLADLVTIGITTKNRWNDLEVTLLNIYNSGLGTLPILIFDDASDECCPFDISKWPLRIQIQRFTESKGLIIRRNQLAQTISTKYYLSLDDDSYPVSGSLSAAVEFAESQDHMFSLSFPIYNPTLNKFQNQSFSREPYQVRCFVGCGHLLHRDKFLQLGGYCEELVHQGEEMDIAARGFQQNFFCYHFPDFLIHHTASNSGRSWHRMDFYGSRNNVFWNDWFVPIELKVYKQFRTLISRLILSIRVRRLGLIKGEIWAFKNLAMYSKYRRNMSLKCYREWSKLRFS